MSWQIKCVESSVKINRRIAKEIFKAGKDDLFYDEEEVLEDELAEAFLRFNSDHGEHQDFLRDRPEIVKILMKHKVSGRVIFQDTEQASQPYGDYWMHEFDGRGGYRFYRGVALITWTYAGGES